MKDRPRHLLRRKLFAALLACVLTAHAVAEPPPPQGTPPFDPAQLDAASARALELLDQDVPFAKWDDDLGLYWLKTRARAPMDSGEGLRESSWLATTAAIAEAMGALEQAEERRRRVLAWRRKLLPDGEPALREAEADLAHTLAELGRVDEAETLAHQALSGPSSPARARATATLALAKARALRGLPTEAEPLFRQAVQLREQAIGAQRGATLDADVDLALFLRAQGRASEANDLLGAAMQPLVAARTAGPRMTRVLLALVDGLDAPADCGQGRTQLAAMRSALLSDSDVSPKQRMRFHESSGRLAACAGDYAEAAAEFEQAGNEFLGGQAFLDSAEFGLANARYALWLAGHPQVATQAGRFARQAVGIAGSRRHQGFANSDAPAFGDAVDRAVHTLGGGTPLALAYEADLAVDWPAHVAGESWALPQAFVSAQELSLSGAATAMAQTRARVAAGSGPLAAVVARQQQLSAQALGLDREAVAALGRGDAEAAQRATAQLAPLKAELGEIDTRLQGEFPDYAAMVSPQALPLRELQGRLAPGEGLLLLLPVREHMHVFAVSRSDARWQRVDQGAASTAQRVARLRCQVDPATCGSGDATQTRGVQSVYGASVAHGGRAFDRDAAYALYKDLVQPVEGALGGVTRLYVASAGDIGKLPLGLLGTRAPSAGEDDADPAVLARGEWLSDRYALVTLPAVSALRAPLPPPAAKPAADGFVGFGAPTLAGAGSAPRGAGNASLFSSAGAGPALADVEALRQLAPLPGTQAELQAMARLYGASAQVLLGNQATEAKLKALPALRQVQVLAFATHGLLPREVRGMDEAGLVFTPPAHASTLDDGVLTASEAATLPLSAEWIILSACNTAAADGSSGAQSLSGLARAFLYAGAESLLASHWRVSDDATAALTTETLALHRGNGSLTRAQALQAAMRAVRTGQRADGSAVPGWKPAWAHPAAWAPFVLVSDRDR